MNPDQEIYHFIGIGGIGMSALARIAVKRGARVKGSDQSPSPLLDELKKEGIAIQIGHRADWVEEGSTIIATTAIDPANPELVYARELGLPLLHRSAFLDRLMQGKRPLLVTGTHGKTTTTALLVSVLLEANWDPSFVVGGIVSSLQINGKGGEGPYFVAEADESDGSFLCTPAFGAIVTNCDRDHLDYWKTEESLQEGFRQFFSRVQKPEHLFWCGDDPFFRSLKPPGFSYGFSQGASLHIAQETSSSRGIRFDLSFQGRTYSAIDLSLWGRHNALNGAAVFGLALTLGVPEKAIRRAFGSFQGTKRRLEFKGEVHGIAVFDDYGHHPTEIRVTLQALRSRIGKKRLVVLFQPHRYTRVRDLIDSFCHCFEEADLAILTDIYSAGEAAIPGVATPVLCARMQQVLKDKLRYIPRPVLSREATRLLQPSDVVLTLGAGDITQVGELLIHHLQGETR